jgi:hypothetical protein
LISISLNDINSPVKNYTGRIGRGVTTGNHIC